MPFPTEIHINPRSREAAFEASQAGQLFLAPRQIPGLVNVNKKLWKNISFNGKIHYFYGDFQQQTVSHYQRVLRVDDQDTVILVFTYYINYIILVGGLEHLDDFSHHIGFMSSSRLTFSPSFFRGVETTTTNQYIYIIYILSG